MARQWGEGANADRAPRPAIAQPPPTLVPDRSSDPGRRAASGKRRSPAPDARARHGAQGTHPHTIESGLLSGQGVQDYDPLRRDRFERLEALRTGDGSELPPMLKRDPPGARSDRAGTTQLAAVERARDALIAWMQRSATTRRSASQTQRLGLSSPRSSAESCVRASANDARWRLTADWRPVLAERRRRTGQGISKSGNRRLRKTMIELAWFWLRHQPDSALSRWFSDAGRRCEGTDPRIAIVRWPANSSSPCGVMSLKASFPRAPYSRRHERSMDLTPFQQAKRDGFAGSGGGDPDQPPGLKHAVKKDGPANPSPIPRA